MALTKPRAYQIFDIDYKQATRVCTVANVTLSGGAPNQVDGINLSLNDRILVTGQTNNVQNGLYYVTTLGTGSNGTWARSVDGDVTGELQSGMIIMVSEGTSYGDTQWKLITDNPITLGVTPLVFTLNYGVPYTVAASPPATGNVVSAQWYDTGSGAVYEYTYDGSSYYWVDITGPTVANAAALTGIVNGNSNIKINTANSNITMGVTGVSNVVVVDSGSFNVTGNISASGAIYSNYNTNTANTASFMATGGNTKGGAGYLDFISVRNTSASSNPYKWMRTTSDGQLQVINSAYTTNIMNLTDVGNFSVPGTISVNYKQAVNGPAFSAYAAAILQTIPNNAQTKVLFQTEEFDTNSCYSSSRFTPNVEGYYQLNAEVRLDGTSGTGEMMIILYKNGSEYKRGTNQSGTQIAANFWAMQVSSVAYANGTTDYFEIYVQQGSGGDRTVTAVNNTAITWFNGCMLRGA